jgi:hypothetical protein
VLDVPAVVREEEARGGWRVEDYEKSLVLLRHGFAHLTTEGRERRRGEMEDEGEEPAMNLGPSIDVVPSREIKPCDHPPK